MKDKPFLAIAFAILAALVLSACNAQITNTPVESTSVSAIFLPTQTITSTALPAATPTSTNTATPAAATPTTAPSSVSVSSTRTITRDDNGRTLNLQVGERFLLDLGDAMEWQLQIDDPSVLSRVPNVLTIKGAQGLFQARQRGQTTLTATGDLPCRKAQPPCMAPSFLFRLQIVVGAAADAISVAPKTVTYADNGQTISLRVGDSFLLKLGADFDWTATVADPTVLSRVANLAVVQGAQGVYAAKKTGDTTLTATGVIVCPPLKLCPALEVSFKLHVVVQ